jgi:hypothetical protein
MDYRATRCTFYDDAQEIVDKIDRLSFFDSRLEIQNFHSVRNSDPEDPEDPESTWFSCGVCRGAPSPCCRAFCHRWAGSGHCRRRLPFRTGQSGRRDHWGPRRRCRNHGRNAGRYHARADPSFVPPNSWIAQCGDWCSLARTRIRCGCVYGCWGRRLRHRHRRHLRGHHQPGQSLPARLPPVGQWPPVGGAPSSRMCGWWGG